MVKANSPAVKKAITLQNLENLDSEPENVFPKTTSTPIKTKATTFKTTPVNSCTNSFTLTFCGLKNCFLRIKVMLCYRFLMLS